MKKTILLTIFCLLLNVSTMFAATPAQAEILAPGLALKDTYTVNSPKNFYRDYPSINQDGTVMPS